MLVGMRIRRLGNLLAAITLLVCPAALDAQEPEWFGRIVAQSSLEPIAGVSIGATPVAPLRLGQAPTPLADVAEIPVAESDSGGAFSVDLPAGTMLRLSAPGFLDGFVLLREGRDTNLGRLVMRAALSVGGRLVIDQTPVEGARITVAKTDEWGVGAPVTETRSGPAGRFRLPRIPSESFDELLVEVDGVAESIEFDTRRDGLDARHYELGDLELSRRGLIEGRVVDADGEAVGDAVVWLDASSSVRLPGRVWERVGSLTIPRPQTRTGADGRSFLVAPRGRYQVSAQTPAPREHALSEEAGILDAEELPMILEAEPEPPGTPLSGLLVDAGGRGISGAMISVVRDADGRRSAALSEADGAFGFEALGPGDYLLAAEWHGSAGMIHPEVLRVGDSTSPDIVVRAPTPVRVSGTITGLRGEERDGLRIQAVTWIEERDRLRQSLYSWATIDASGRFHFNGLTPGTWTIRASTESWRSTTQELVVEAGSVEREIEISFPRGYTLTGIVRWRSAPPPRAGLGLSGPESRRLLFDTSQPFRVHDLAPGLYRIQIASIGLQSPHFSWIEVQEDTTIDIQIRAGSVSGRVIDAETGAPIAGAEVVTNPVPMYITDSHVEFRRADDNGRFHAGPFAAGRWSFHVSAPGYATRTPNIDIGSTDLADYDIALRPTAGLRLRFSTPRPAPPGRVTATWLDLDTGEIVSISTLPGTRESTETVWPDIPLGRGVLTARRFGPRGVARLEVDNRGQTVDVLFERPGALVVRVPAFTDDPPYRATLHLRDPAGRLVPSGSTLLGHGYHLARADDRFQVSDLPPGRYELRVESFDGRSWSGTADVRADETTEVNLR